MLQIIVILSLAEEANIRLFEFIDSLTKFDKKSYNQKL